MGGLSHAALTVMTLDGCGEGSGLIYLCSALLSRPQHHLLSEHAALQGAFQCGVTLCESHEFQPNEVILSQDMYGNFLPPSEDSASHGRVLFDASFRDRGEVFSHLLLAKAHPALTMTDRPG